MQIYYTVNAVPVNTKILNFRPILVKIPYQNHSKSGLFY